MEIKDLTHLQAHGAMNSIVTDSRLLEEQVRVLVTKTEWFDPAISMEILDLLVQVRKKYLDLLRKSLNDMGYSNETIDQVVAAMLRLMNGES